MLNRWKVWKEKKFPFKSFKKKCFRLLCTYKFCEKRENMCKIYNDENNTYTLWLYMRVLFCYNSFELLRSSYFCSRPCFFFHHFSIFLVMSSENHYMLFYVGQVRIFQFSHSNAYILHYTCFMLFYAFFNLNTLFSVQHIHITF